MIKKGSSCNPPKPAQAYPNKSKDGETKTSGNQIYTGVTAAWPIVFKMNPPTCA